MRTTTSCFPEGWRSIAVFSFPVSHFPKGVVMNTQATVTNLIRHATALVSGWRTRPVPREVWHRADDLLQQAALLDEDSVMPVWSWRAREYEAWVEREDGEDA